MKNPLVQAREQLGLTQQEVALQTGTSQQYIQRLEAGQQSKCPPLIATFYDSVLHENITQHYADWVYQDRQQLRDLSKYFEHAQAEADKYNISFLSGQQMFNDLCLLLEFDPRVDNAVIRVSEKLHVHPVIIARWRQNGGMPPTLVAALKETKK